MIKHNQFMAMAYMVALSSYATKAQVGAVIVKNNKVIATGYNGTLPNLENECEVDNKTKDYVVHAESNAIMTALKNKIDLSDCIIYTTYSPCSSCYKLIIQSGIKVVYYDIAYKYGVPNWVKQCKVKVEKV